MVTGAAAGLPTSSRAAVARHHARCVPGRATGRPRAAPSCRAEQGRSCSSRGVDQSPGPIAAIRWAAAGAALATALALAPPLTAAAQAEQPRALEVEAAARGGVVERATPAFLGSKGPAPSAEELRPEELANVRLFQENTPSVVNIANLVQARSRFNMDVVSLPQGQGSGFVWDTEGRIVTNYHVIRGASSLRVALIDQSVWPARLLGGDPLKDVAVLQLEAPPEVLRNLPPVRLGDSDGLLVGQNVVAIGNPFGLDHSMSTGVISGLNRELPSVQGPSLRNMLQITAPINPGNSGGPLLDSKGRVIGINAAILGAATSTGVGFAVPIGTVQGLVDQVIKFGRVSRPMLGVVVAPPQAVRQLGVEGVMVLEVSRGGPAEAAGLRGVSRDRLGRLVVGDVIVGVQGRPVRREGDLFDALDRCKVGESVEVQVLRRGEGAVTVRVTLAERQAGFGGAE